MKDYGFDYMNYITNLPSNMIDIDKSYNMNQMNNMNKMDKMNELLDTNKFKNIFKMKDKTELIEPYEGLVKGNLFANLYDPYKNYRPMELDPDNERDALLY